MKYEEPKLEIVTFEISNVVTLSAESEGTGNNTTGPWG